MKRVRLIVIGVLIVLAALVFFTLRTKNITPLTRAALTITPAPSTSPILTTRTTASPTPPTLTQQVNEAERNAAVEAVQSVYGAPISFYGRAQDQYGEPVAEAKVQYSALDKFWEPGTKYEGVTDARGYFSITGIEGAALSVHVSKEGYDRIYNQSDGAFSFGVPYNPQRDRPTPTKNNPAVFVLRKKTAPEPLVAIDRDVLVPKDGTPVDVSLKNGKPVPAGQGDIALECWTSDQTKDAQGRYDWRFRFSVPGGGLLKRTDPELAFEAPETGYDPNIEFHMPQASERWQEDYDEQFWLKLRDGRYARMRLRMTTGGGHFASITAYLNPSGSRNLEYDPRQQVPAR